jgi:uncharacterized protein
MAYFVERQIESVRVVSVIHICRDADDNRIIAASLDSECSHLVTGDSELRILKKFETVSIVTPRELLELIPND